jgi:hypothetical protein
VRLIDIYRWLPIHSKATRERLDQERAAARSRSLQRERQAHYRMVTGAVQDERDRRV